MGKPLLRTKATHGLPVSWGGFKSSVEREMPHQFFEVRLRDRKELIVRLLSVYDKPDADLRAELPLKQVWMITLADENM